MEEAERELIERAQRADGHAIDSLIERHLPRLRAFVRLRVGGVVRARDDVSDLVQSACREVLQDVDRHACRDEEHFRRWLYQAALRKILDRHRYWRAEKRDPGREEARAAGDAESVALVYRTLLTPSEDAARREDVDRLEEAFEGLPDDYREVIFLARMLELEYPEIAERMERTEGAVRVLLSRALARLAGLLDARD